jgi:hypothetical protein
MERRASSPVCRERSRRVHAQGRGGRARTPGSPQALLRRRRLVLRNGRRRRWSGSNRLRRCLCLLHARKHRCRPSSPGRKNRQRNRRDHENDRRPGCSAGKSRSRSSRPEGRLAALSAERRSQVATLTTLQQHYSNKEKANKYVNDCDQDRYPHAQNSRRAEAQIVRCCNYRRISAHDQGYGAEGGI